MARPDCDDGYYKIAYELGAALLSFGFGEIEGHILAVVLETQYGLGKRKSVELSPAKLSAEWEIPRQNVHRAIATLVARNVLLSLGGGEYVLVKDYQQWDKKGSTARVRLWHGFVSDAPSRAKAFKPLPAPKDRDDLIIEGMPGVNDGADAVIFKDDTQTAANESPSSSTMTTRHRQRLQTVIVNDDEQGVSPGPPIGEAHAECKKGRSEEESVCVDARGEPAEQEPSPDLVAFIEAKVVKSCKDGIFAADFSPGFAKRWLMLAGGDAELVKQAAYAFAEEHIGSRAIPSWAESYIRRQAERRARQPKTIPIESAARPSPPRLSPTQQRIQDTMAAIDIIAERERIAREGA